MREAYAGRAFPCSQPLLGLGDHLGSISLDGSILGRLRQMLEAMRGVSSTRIKQLFLWQSGRSPSTSCSGLCGEYQVECMSCCISCRMLMQSDHRSCPNSNLKVHEAPNGTNDCTAAFTPPGIHLTWIQCRGSNVKPIARVSVGDTPEERIYGPRRDPYSRQNSNNIAVHKRLLLSTSSDLSSRSITAIASSQLVEDQIEQCHRLRDRAFEQRIHWEESWGFFAMRTISGSITH